MKFSNPIFVALDTTNLDRAVSLAGELFGLVGGVKLGKTFFTAHGPDGVRRITARGVPVFLDLKWHDIPNTVAGAVRAALPLTPFMVNVHASGGAVMMRAAAEAAATAGKKRPLVLGVTVLTSMGPGDLTALGVDRPLEAQVRALAVLAAEAGLDGVVCSAHEVAALRASFGPNFKLVVPGIRPEWAAGDDQRRTMTPAEAISQGADYLVIGRPITAAKDPVAAAQRIVDELSH